MKVETISGMVNMTDLEIEAKIIGKPKMGSKMIEVMCTCLREQR